MEWITWLLFESRPPLAAVLFTANFVLLVYWRRHGRPRPLLVGLAVAGALLVLQTLVVTRREHALRILGGIEKDVVVARTDALAAALAPDFAAGGRGPDEFIALVSRLYETVRIRSVNRSWLRVAESSADQFVVAAAYQGAVTARDYAGPLPTRWEMTFVRTAAGWQIGSIRATYILGVPDPCWDALDRY